MYKPTSPGLRPTAFPWPPPQPLYSPALPPPDPFWQRQKLQTHLASLLENLAILKSIGDELETLQSLESPYSGTGHSPGISKAAVDENLEAEQPANDRKNWGLHPAGFSPGKGILLKIFQENVNCLPESASLATQAAQQLLGVIEGQLKPLNEALDGSAGQERVLAAKKLASRRKKVIRNRKWRSRKRQRLAEALRKEREQYEKADREADEWRAREIAKVIAKRKMEKMKALAEKKSKEEKERRQEELELVLIIEKLQELRALRIVKLKKQGLFFPEEDDQFVERVRAAVEEEERQAAAARNTNAAAAAILNAEEARKAAIMIASDHADRQEKGELEGPIPVNLSLEPDEQNLSQNNTEADLKKGAAKMDEETPKVLSKEKGSVLLKGYEGLPTEFHQYYFGSSFDMGTLIEVRQAWDAFIMPGGSRIPQHWVDPPPPANAVWGSYVVKQHAKKKRKRTVK